MTGKTRRQRDIWNAQTMLCRDYANHLMQAIRKKQREEDRRRGLIDCVSLGMPARSRQVQE